MSPLSPQLTPPSRIPSFESFKSPTSSNESYVSANSSPIDTLETLTIVSANSSPIETLETLTIRSFVPYDRSQDNPLAMKYIQQLRDVGERRFPSITELLISKSGIFPKPPLDYIGTLTPSKPDRKRPIPLSEVKSVEEQYPSTPRLIETGKPTALCD